MTVGAQLRQARAARGLSVHAVMAETKIQPWVLEAMEEDRLHTIMSPIYVKGFLTSYARFLHLDPQPLLAQVPWPPAEPEPASSPPPLPPPVRLVFRLRVPEPLRRRLGAALAVSLAVAGLMAVNPLRQPLQRTRAEATPAPAASQPATPKLASLTSVSAPMEPPSPPALPNAVPSPLELMMKAHRTTWIRVRADGKLLTQQRLGRGAEERWTAKQQFEVIISKPSQVELILNGQPLSSFAIAHRGRRFPGWRSRRA